MTQVPLTFLLLLTLSLGHSFVLDLTLKEDMDPTFWSKINCRYFYNYTEYINAQGCNFTLPEAAAAFANREGFWAPCSKETCDLVYYGNSLPVPTNVTVEWIGKNSAVSLLQVSAKKHFDETDNDYESRENVKGNDLTTFEWSKILVSNVINDTDYVFKFTLTMNDDSLSLIDRITFNYDGVSDPRTTTTTTQAPGPGTTFTVATKADLTPQWEVNCNYANHPEDFWVYGCPADTTDVDPTTFGYWTPCHVNHCDFIFKAGENNPLPGRIDLTGIFRDDGLITVSRRKDVYGSLYEILDVVNSSHIQANTWGLDLPNECYSDIYNISISGSHGAILVDTFTMKLQDDNTCIEVEEPAKPTLGPWETTTSGSQVATAFNFLTIGITFAIANLFN